MHPKAASRERGVHQVRSTERACFCGRGIRRTPLPDGPRCPHSPRAPLPEPLVRHPCAWPLTLVDELYLFGSYARGALEPHDVDITVDFHRDERMPQREVASHFSGPPPHSELRRQLAGRSRGIRFRFDTALRRQLESVVVPMLRLWRRGDSLQHL
ncbi:nucleotidyltransferase domain-containing protein [Streptomyces sp. 900105245]